MSQLNSDVIEASLIPSTPRKTKEVLKPSPFLCFFLLLSASLFAIAPALCTACHFRRDSAASSISSSQVQTVDTEEGQWSSTHHIHTQTEMRPFTLDACFLLALLFDK
eukprot:scaffold4744_cov150-Skeletonema_marinoi.AAC.1